MKRALRRLCAIGLFTSFTTYAQPVEYRGFWIDAFGNDFKTPDQVTKLISEIRQANANFIVPEIRKRGDAYYNGSPYEPKAPDIVPSSFDPLQDMIDKAHDTSGGKQRLDVYGWIVSYKIWGAEFATPPVTTPPHPYTVHKDWLTRDSAGATWDGSSYAFDPGHPEVQKYTYDVCMDIISRYDLDGFNFDYIRYTGNSWGYHPITVQRFNRRHGRGGQPAPTDPLWMQFRRDQVTALVRKVYLNATALKPHIKISADTITWGAAGVANEAQWYSSAAWRDVLQDWRGWMEEGILDINIPMNYYRAHEYPAAYTNWMNFAKDHKYSRHVVIGPGLYLNSTANAILQMRGSRELSQNGFSAEGVCGYVYKQPDNQGTTFSTFKNYLTNSPNTYDPLSPAIFHQRAELPAMPWKSAPIRGHLKGFVRSSTGEEIDGASVQVTGPVARGQTNDATGFYGFVDLPPGNYSITATFPGYASQTTNISISAGAVSTFDFALNLKGPPEFVSEPQSQTVYQGVPVVFAGWASGSGQIGYHWLFQGEAISGANGPELSIPAANTNHIGAFALVASNSFGMVTSRVANLMVQLPKTNPRLAPLWSLPPGTRPYLTTGSTERGLAYNPASGRLLVVNRAGPSVHVLNAETGEDLHELDTSSVWGGYTSAYYLMMIRAADDGAVYACNLTLSPSTVPLVIYRWNNDEPFLFPETVYAGDPIPGSSQRWGDTFDVRGTGPATQILMGSRNGNQAVIFTTLDGYYYDPKPITVSSASAGAFGLGIAFGKGDTFWGKTTGGGLLEIGFNLTNGTGHVISGYSSAFVAGNIGPIGVSSNYSNLAGIAIGTPDNLQVFDLGTKQVSLVGTNAFPTDNDNPNNTGSVDFGGDRVFALNSGNGIVALRVLPPPTQPAILTHPAPVIARQGQNVAFTVSAQGSDPLLYQWERNSIPIQSATNATLQIGPAIPSDQAIYRVWVTNEAGGLYSDSALLTVITPPPPQLAAMPLQPASDGSFQVAWSGATGFTYVVQYSTNLVHWTSLWTNEPGLIGVFLYKDTTASNRTSTFYRIRDWP